MEHSTRYSILSPLSRLLISVIFIIGGLTKFATWNKTVALLGMMGIPFPHVALTIAAIIEFAGGLSLLFGAGTRPMATLLALYLIPVTLIFHGFWYAGPNTGIQFTSFLKNLAIIGGLVGLAINGAGETSVDAKLGRRRLETERRTRELRRVA